MAMMSIRRSTLPGAHRSAAAQPFAGSRGCARRVPPPVRSSGEEGFFSPAFKEALQQAMQRDESAAIQYSSSSSSYARPPPPAAESNSAGPLLQVLATALGQSRATLQRLQTEEAEIENLIQRERKQVERLEFLLEKVQRDYAYFTTLERRFEEMGSR